MKEARIFGLFLLTICLTSCSSMVSDFKKMTRGVQYTVEHHQEVVAEYQAGSDEQSNFVLDEEGNLQLQYALFESETLYALPGSQTEALAKTYEGFGAKTFQQEEVLADGSTVVKIYYERNLVTVIANIGEGSWNYQLCKQDPSVEEENDTRSVTRKYGSECSINLFTDDFSLAGKKGCSLTKWAISGQNVEPSETELFISTFPAQDTDLTAIWEFGKPANYSVHHYFEKVDCQDNTKLDSDNYELNGELTTVKQGQSEFFTETKDCVLSVPGFTAREHSEKEINGSGSTTVEIYYVRNSIDIKLSTDEGLWNYDAWKADKDNVAANTSEKIISGRFGTAVDYSAINSLKKTGMDLSGWNKGESTVLIKTQDLPETFPVEDSSYSAVWIKKNPVAYKIVHMTEKLASNDSEDLSNYAQNSVDSSKKGIPEYFTEAEAIEIPGFTYKETVQEEIAQDGSSVAHVYYSRNQYSLTLDLNGGYWNYSEYKDDKTTILDSESIVYIGKYEEPVSIAQFPSKGKRAHDFIAWKDLESGISYSEENLASAFSKFPSKNITLTAQWQMGDGVEYKVQHWFENVDSTSSTINSNFTLDENLTQTGLGEEAGDYTEAVARHIPGFTLRDEIVQQTIKADGSTVVNLYYTRNSSSFIFDADGGSVVGQDTISGKYESLLDADSTPGATRSGWTFGGWLLNGKLVSDEEMKLQNQKFELADKTFKAYWVSMASVGGKSIFTDITLNKIQTESAVNCTVTLPVGYENETWTYKWYVDGVYASDETEFHRSAESLGRGVHTITVKATMNRQNFTQRITATIN